jgi:hypothetical protein
MLIAPSEIAMPPTQAVMAYATEITRGRDPSPARRFFPDRILGGLADCGRITRDIVIGVLCGATAGLFVAMVDASF